MHISGSVHVGPNISMAVKICFPGLVLVLIFVKHDKEAYKILHIFAYDFREVKKVWHQESAFWKAIHFGRWTLFKCLILTCTWSNICF